MQGNCISNFACLNQGIHLKNQLMTATFLYVLSLALVLFIKNAKKKKPIQTLFYNILQSNYFRMKVPITNTKFLLVGIVALVIMAFTRTFESEKPTIVLPPVGPSTTQEVIDAANAFRATLTAAQVATCFLTYSLTEAQKWSNFPVGIYNNRVGIKMSALTTAQLAAAKNLMKVATGTGTEGYNEIEAILAADDYLGANGGGANYTSGNYFIALLGTPALTGTWQLYFGGHHLAQIPIKMAIWSAAHPRFAPPSLTRSLRKTAKLGNL
jgi:hypothetical protein